MKILDGNNYAPPVKIRTSCIFFIFFLIFYQIIIKVSPVLPDKVCYMQNIEEYIYINIYWTIELCYHRMSRYLRA